MADFQTANLANWEERAQLHATDTTGMYRIAPVLAGRSVLHAIEAEDIGDVAGLRVAHLQCHIGLDTLSLAHLGAEAVGLDFSKQAITAARAFAEQAGRSDVKFFESDVYSARAVLPGDFDLVYVTWGAINWLADIRAWAEVVAFLLKPGGRIYMAETHPVTTCLEQVDERLEALYDWRTPVDKPLASDDAFTYTGDQRPLLQRRTYNWIHPLSAIINALFSAGLRLCMFKEHESLPYRLFPSMVPDALDENGFPTTYRLPEGMPRLPLSFSLFAERVGGEGIS